MEKKYELRTIKDIFDKVPADRIEDCLAELTVIMVQAKHLEAAMCEAAGAVTGNKPDKAFEWPETSTWIDDGKGELTARVVTKDNEEILKVKTKI